MHVAILADGSRAQMRATEIGRKTRPAFAPSFVGQLLELAITQMISLGETLHPNARRKIRYPHASSEIAGKPAARFAPTFADAGASGGCGEPT